MGNPTQEKPNKVCVNNYITSEYIADPVPHCRVSNSSKLNISIGTDLQEVKAKTQ